MPPTSKFPPKPDGNNNNSNNNGARRASSGSPSRKQSGGENKQSRASSNRPREGDRLWERERQHLLKMSSEQLMRNALKMHFEILDLRQGAALLSDQTNTLADQLTQLDTQAMYGGPDAFMSPESLTRLRLSIAPGEGGDAATQLDISPQNDQYHSQQVVSKVKRALSGNVEDAIKQLSSLQRAIEGGLSVIGPVSPRRMPMLETDPSLILPDDAPAERRLDSTVVQLSQAVHHLLAQAFVLAESVTEEKAANQTSPTRAAEYLALRAAVNAGEKEIEVENSRSSRLQKQLDAMDDTVKHLRAARGDLEETCNVSIHQLQAQHERLQQQNTDLQLKLRNAELERDRAREEIDRWKKDFEDVKEQNEELEREQAKLQSENGMNKLLADQFKSDIEDLLNSMNNSSDQSAAAVHHLRRQLQLANEENARFVAQLAALQAEGPLVTEEMLVRQMELQDCEVVNMEERLEIESEWLSRLLEMRLRFQKNQMQRAINEAITKAAMLQNQLNELEAQHAEDSDKSDVSSKATQRKYMAAVASAALSEREEIRRQEVLLNEDGELIVTLRDLTFSALRDLDASYVTIANQNDKMEQMQARIEQLEYDKHDTKELKGLLDTAQKAFSTADSEAGKLLEYLGQAREEIARLHGENKRVVEDSNEKLQEMEEKMNEAIETEKKTKERNDELEACMEDLDKKLNEMIEGLETKLKTVFAEKESLEKQLAEAREQDQERLRKFEELLKEANKTNLTLLEDIESFNRLLLQDFVDSDFFDPQSEAQNEIANKTKMIGELENEVEKLQRDLHSRGAASDDEFKKMCDQLSVSEDMKKQLEKLVEELNSQIGALTQKNEDLENENASLKNGSEESIKTNEILKRQSDELAQENESLKQEIDQLRLAKEESIKYGEKLKQQNDELTQENENLKKDISNLKQENNELKEEQEKLQREMDETSGHLKNRAAASEDDYKNLQREAKELSATADELRKKLEDLVNSLRDRDESIADLQKQLSALQSAKQDSDDKNKQLEEQLEKLRQQLEQEQADAADREKDLVVEQGRLQQELNREKQRVSELEDSLQASDSETRQKLSEAQCKNVELQSDLDHATIERDNLSKHAESLKNRIEEIEKQLEEGKKQLEAERAKNAELEAQNEKLSAQLAKMTTSRDRLKAALKDAVALQDELGKVAEIQDANQKLAFDNARLAEQLELLRAASADAEKQVMMSKTEYAKLEQAVANAVGGANDLNHLMETNSTNSNNNNNNNNNPSQGNDQENNNNNSNLAKNPATNSNTNNTPHHESINRVTSTMSSAVSAIKRHNKNGEMTCASIQGLMKLFDNLHHQLSLPQPLLMAPTPANTARGVDSVNSVFPQILGRIRELIYRAAQADGNATRGGSGGGMDLVEQTLLEEEIGRLQIVADESMGFNEFLEDIVGDIEERAIAEGSKVRRAMEMLEEAQFSMRGRVGSEKLLGALDMLKQTPGARRGAGIAALQGRAKRGGTVILNINELDPKYRNIAWLVSTRGAMIDHLGDLFKMVYAQPFYLDKTQRAFGTILGTFLTQIEKMHIGLPPYLLTMEVVKVREATDKELARILVHSSAAVSHPKAADSPECSPVRVLHDGVDRSVVGYHSPGRDVSTATDHADVTDESFHSQNLSSIQRLNTTPPARSVVSQWKSPPPPPAFGTFY